MGQLFTNMGSEAVIFICQNLSFRCIEKDFRRVEIPFRCVKKRFRPVEISQVYTQQELTSSSDTVH